MKKSSVKSKKKKRVLAVEKNVMIFLRSSIQAAILEANAEIKRRNPAWEAKPIEFALVDAAGSFQVTVNFKKNAKGDGSQITYTTDPQLWNFTLTKNHPTIAIGGIVYYIGIV